MAMTGPLSPETLRKALEWELSLSCDDLRSHGWYHGSISRQRAENLLQHEGDFLVRDCHSLPGDYVLSVKCKYQNLHFVINKVICQPHTVYERVQYAFEDEPFDTVTDLVTFYIGNRRPISSASGAIITSPVTRCVPLNVDKSISLNVLTKRGESPSKSLRTESPQTIDNDDSRPLFALPSFHSNVQPRNFQTYLIPKDNKPLESRATIKIHSVLTDTGPRILANHLTKCNLQFIHHYDGNKKSDLGLGVCSSLELMLLPQGEETRFDLLDRFDCLKYFIIVSLVTCKDTDKRAEILGKWILMAMECKTALGDCFSFEAIMEALSNGAITGLRQTWLMLRQYHTQTAICYETKLRPMVKCIYENPLQEQAPNTVFPSIIVLANVLLNENNNNIIEKMDLQQLHNHCEYGRIVASQLHFYRRNATIVMESVTFEDLLLDMFRTEFHRRFLWGAKGCDAEKNMRMEKLQQIVDALVNQL